MAMHDEVELKLSIDDKNLERWRRTPILRRYAKGRSSTRKLVSTYFDTPDLDLKAEGIALRVRRVGRKRVQTLKAPGPADTGFQHLLEYEHEIPGNLPDLDLIEDARLQTLFERSSARDRLAEVFTTSFKRKVMVLDYGDSEIEMALDDGEILARGARMPLHEAEFELRNGDPIDLLNLALEIHGELPFTLGGSSKAARGYALFSRSKPVPARAKPVTLKRKSSAAKAFTTLAWNCVNQIRANELPLLRTDDPEAVHQMRVGLRRLRSLLGLYQPFLAPETLTMIVAELAWAQQQLGPARDWDVFVEETVAQVAAAMPEETSLRSLRQVTDYKRSLANQAACDFVSGERYTVLLLRLFKALEQSTMLALGDPSVRKAMAKPIVGLAGSLLDARERKVRKLAKRIGGLEVADLHRLRLRVKKLRYAADFFRSLFPAKAAKQRYKALAALQDALGAFNDAAVCHDLVEEMQATAPRNVNLRIAGGVMRGWYGARAKHAITELQALWDGYEKSPCFWK